MTSSFNCMSVINTEINCKSLILHSMELFRHIIISLLKCVSRHCSRETGMDSFSTRDIWQLKTASLRSSSHKRQFRMHSSECNICFQRLLWSDSHDCIVIDVNSARCLITRNREWHRVRHPFLRRHPDEHSEKHDFTAEISKGTFWITNRFNSFKTYTRSFGNILGYVFQSPFQSKTFFDSIWVNDKISIGVTSLSR